jgi:hypothetical protein
MSSNSWNPKDKPEDSDDLFIVLYLLIPYPSTSHSQYSIANPWSWLLMKKEFFKDKLINYIKINTSLFNQHHKA